MYLHCPCSTTCRSTTGTAGPLSAAAAGAGDDEVCIGTGVAEPARRDCELDALNTLPLPVDEDSGVPPIAAGVLLGTAGDGDGDCEVLGAGRLPLSV